MKTVGLLGGMSWESTQIYYRELNRLINQEKGGLHSAKIIMINVDFQPIEQLMIDGNWHEICQILTTHCQTLQNAGVDCIAIATNTMHKLVPQIETKLNVPILHIADSVAKVLNHQNISTVGLLGTAFTMQEEFYHAKLNRHQIKTLIPNEEDQADINTIIFDELCLGQFIETSKQKYLTVIDGLIQQGANAVVLACTEIGLLVNQQDCETPLIDATDTHIRDIVNFVLRNK